MTSLVCLQKTVTEHVPVNNAMKDLHPCYCNMQFGNHGIIN